MKGLIVIMEQILEIPNIWKKYQQKNGETLAIKDINLKVKKGEFVSIIGPSGCGKSTLLSIISGLEYKTEGKILIENEEVQGISSKIGYMLQKDCLLEWRTIYSNILLGLEIKGIKNKENIQYAENLLKKYGLFDFKDRFPNQLSGGMRQRAALIRTLSVKPKILLLDEAFSALDYQTRIKVTVDIYNILKKEKITTLMVTHDITDSRFQSRLLKKVLDKAFRKMIEIYINLIIIFKKMLNYGKITGLKNGAK